MSQKVPPSFGTSQWKTAFYKYHNLPIEDRMEPNRKRVESSCLNKHHDRALPQRKQHYSPIHRYKFDERDDPIYIQDSYYWVESSLRLKFPTQMNKLSK